MQGMKPIVRLVEYQLQSESAAFKTLALLQVLTLWNAINQIQNIAQSEQDSI